jgi:hypothetical protein
MVKSRLCRNFVRPFALGLIWAFISAQVLAPVFTSLTTAKLQALNAKIAIEEKPARDVAKRHLEALGAAPKADSRTSPWPLRKTGLL